MNLLLKKSKSLQPNAIKQNSSVSIDLEGSVIHEFSEYHNSREQEINFNQTLFEEIKEEEEIEEEKENKEFESEN